jgi:hypothetical protein
VMTMSGGGFSTRDIGVVDRLAVLALQRSGSTGLVVVSAMTAVAEKMKCDKCYAQKDPNPVTQQPTHGALLQVWVCLAASRRPQRLMSGWFALGRRDGIHPHRRRCELGITRSGVET